MLELISIFLMTFLTAATAVWLYRKVSGWQRFSQSPAVRSVRPARKKMGVQQGFISLNSTRREKAKNVKPLSPQGGIKAPWGW